MKEKLRKLKKGSPDAWPALALLEFTVALARAMKAKNMKQKDLADALEVSPPYISSVMSGNENLTVEQMSRLAEAVGCSLHLTLAPEGLYVRWIEDTLEEHPTEATTGPSIRRYEAYRPFAPLFDVTSSRHSVERMIQDPRGRVAAQDVYRPTQPTFSPRSTGSTKPFPRGGPFDWLGHKERRTQ